MAGQLNDVNLIDEELILDALEKASDYEMGVARLDEKGKGIVTKLRKFAGTCGEMAGCDDAGDDPNPTPPPLTPAKALQSISSVIRYLDTINDPTACKAEGLLTTISRQICSEWSRRMKETTITNYFPPRQ